MGRAEGRSARVAGSLLALLLCCACGSGGDGSGGGVSDATTLGFVVSSFGYEFPQDAGDACPGGFNEGPLEMRINHGSAIPDDCQNPLANVDPGFKTYAADAQVDGFDLDGAVPPPTTGGCAHQEFSGPGGASGLDYQLWRAIGCVRGFQQGEVADIVIGGAVKAGSMTILVEVVDVDDVVNDDDVGVRLYASLDTPPTGGDGSLVPYGTLSEHPDPRYHSSEGRGRIVDGVLLAGPMDVRLRLNIQIVQGDLSFSDAWVRLELLPDGRARGRIFGYQPVDEVYEIFGRQAGAAGAEALSYTCTGLYAALQGEADGGFDASTGRCSSLSAIYRFEAEPAFIVPAEDAG